MRRVHGATRIVIAAAAFFPGLAAGESTTAGPRSGRELYEAACASCHGSDGRGTAAATASFPIAPPDFTDCNFASREPDNDWVAVGHGGGPARGFDRLMPSFAGVLGREELGRVVSHVRGFCVEDGWPRGELNLPRALVTSKAFPEDEAALRVYAGDGAVTTRFVYARRIAAKNQLEVVVPVVLVEQDGGSWSSGAGDFSLGFKRVLAHSLGAGAILSAAAELVLPTGRAEIGAGGGTTVLEGFLAYGQLLGRRTFVQLQAGGGVAWDREHADELFARGLLGHRFVQDRGLGRAWSPMLEVLVARELGGDAATEVDVVPQLQVTLSARQHVVACAGVRLPITDRTDRSAQVMVYLIWDWFDGGFLAGW
jgi:mono/diheme cytochrome c family protein